MNNDKFDIKLDDEEKALLDSYDNGEWQSVKNIKQGLQRAAKSANNYLQKNTRIGIA